MRDVEAVTANRANWDDRAEVANVEVHEWRHASSEVIGALLRAGLRIEAFDELPYMDWHAFPELVPCPQGWTLPAEVPRIPLNFAVVARRPD